MDKKIKILYVHHVGQSGGSSNSLSYLLETLPSNIEKHIITPNGPVVEKFKKITPHVYIIKNHKSPPVFSSVQGVKFMWLRIALNFLSNYKVLDEIEEILERVKPDLVHLNENSLIFEAKRIKKYNYPIVMHARIAMSKHDPIINRVSERMIYKYTDRVIAITGSVKNRFKQTDKIDIVYNSFPKKYTIDFPERKKGEKLICLFLANLFPFKGIFETIEAAKILKDNKNIHFLVAGANVRTEEFFQKTSGKVLDAFNIYPNVERRIKEDIEKDNLTNIELLGFVKQIEELFSNTHVLLAPCRLNAPPRNVFEAGTYGIPSILALQDRVDDVVKDNFNGLVINERNPQAIVDAVLKYEQDEQMRIEHGKNAMKRYNVTNNPNVQTPKVIDIYNKVLAEYHAKN